VIPRAKKIAIKFCGGCNPTFDRLQYWEQVKAETGDTVTWVSPDHPDRETVLLICGCHTSCPVKNLPPEDGARLILVRDIQTAPEETARKIFR
jgi:hypothetical protein